VFQETCGNYFPPFRCLSLIELSSFPSFSSCLRYGFYSKDKSHVLVPAVLKQFLEDIDHLLPRDSPARKPNLDVFISYSIKNKVTVEESSVKRIALIC
jgi:hypothetical protein